MTATRGPAPIFHTALALFVAVALPIPALGQEPTVDSAVTEEAPMSEAPRLDDEEFRRFVVAHLAINEARDEFHGEMARVHDPEGRARAREAADERIAAILEEQELSRETYDRMVLLISLDGEARTRFEEMVAEVESQNAR